ncbi:MAG: response regulator [Chloroflexota bacterium]|nr:response regulator [Chloroflexota bacterium]
MISHKKQLRVLLVEDEVPHQRLFARSLSRSRMDGEVVCVDDGQLALDYLNAYADSGDNTPLIVILDLNIPIRDGIEVLGEIRKHPRLYNLPVIIMSTSDETVEINACRQLGVLAYLVKPVEFERIETLVESVLKRGEAR